MEKNKLAKGQFKKRKEILSYIGEFTLNDGVTILAMIRREDKLIAGGVTNAGLIEEFTFEIEYMFSIDENISDFITEIEENIQ